MKNIYNIFIEGYQSLGSRAKFSLGLYTGFLTSLSILDGIGLLLLASLIQNGGTPIDLSSQLVVLLIIFLFTLKSFLAVVGMHYGLKEFVKIEVDIGEKNFRNLLSTPWIDQREQKSNDYFNLIDRGPKELVVGTFLNVSTLVSEIITIAVVVIVIFVAQPLTALTTFVYFGLAAIVQHKFLAEATTNAGIAATKQQNLTYQILEDAAGLGKLLKVNPSKTLESNLRNEREKLSKARNLTWYYMSLPRYLLEGVLAVGFIVVGLVSLGVNGPSSVLPAVGFFAVAGFRLLPSINRVQGLIFGIMSASSLAQIGATGLKTPTEHQRSHDNLVRGNSVAEFSNVGFSFPDSNAFTIKNFSFEFEHGKQYALVGSSGSGKSTVIDLMLGLLHPTEGFVRFDREKHQVGFVPQDTKVFRGNIYQNVALEWDVEAIDVTRVENCLRQVGIDNLFDLTADMMDNKDKAINISGGQKQRIGLARALYRIPSVLILDEATSALDGITETDIMHEINNFKGRLTTIIVAHRLSTIRNVDHVLYLEEGTISPVTNWEQLYQRNASFRNQVDAGRI